MLNVLGYSLSVRVMVSGASGQIGTYLLPILQNRGFTVATLGRHEMQAQEHGFQIENYIIKDYDLKVINFALSQFMPDAFVNLASISSVASCEKNPELSKSINLDLPLAILDFIKSGVIGNCLFIQASSSEMYTGVSKQQISELTEINPRSVYGKHKAKVHQSLDTYRDLYGVRASGLVLFNNESKLRDDRFASKRIVRDLVRIKKGLLGEFRMGNDYVLRDWNHPTDTSRAIELIIRNGRVENFVIGSGELHSVRELIEVAANLLEIDLSALTIVKDPQLARSLENHGLSADSSKIRRELGWSPRYTFREIVEEIVLNELREFK